MGCCTSKNYDDDEVTYTQFECVTPDEILDDKVVSSPVSHQIISKTIAAESNRHIDINGKFGPDFFKGKKLTERKSQLFLDIGRWKIHFLKTIYDPMKQKNIYSVLTEICGKANNFIQQPHFFKLYEDRLFMDEPYAEGKNLNYFLRYFDYKIPESIVTFFTSQIVLGLNFLHKNNILHGNLSLKNILLFHDGYVKITNFSSSLVSKVRCKLNISSLEYMAPEVCLGKPCDSAADWWSLGICMSLMMGQYPFEIERIIDSIIFDQPILPTEASVPCRTFMQGLLIKNHNERLQHVFSENGEIYQHAIFKTTPMRDVAEKKVQAEFHIRYMFSDIFSYGFQI